MRNEERIGDLLKKLRTSKGLHLREVEESLHIRRSYLEAIEESEYEKIPSEVYARGFLKNYARFLGVNPEMALDRFQKERQTSTSKAKSSRLARRRKTDSEESTEKNSSKKSIWILRGAIFAVVLFLGIWQGPNALRYIENQMANYQSGAVQVEAIAEENMWIQVWVDGKIVAEGFLQKGEQKTWQGKQEIQIIGGHGSEFKVQVNGVLQNQIVRSDGINHQIFRAYGK